MNYECKIYAIILLNLFFHAHGLSFNNNMRSFSDAKKAGYCSPGQEYTLFEYQNGPGVLTEQWYTGGTCFNEKTILHYYIDGDTKPTIGGNLFMMHGIGFYDSSHPAWGTKWMGHTAAGGSLYNLFRIPFQKSIRISFIPPGSGRYWYIVRGVENYPIKIGDLTLPSNTKLVLHKIEDQIYSPLTFVPLVTSVKKGIIFSVNLRAESKNFHYLEGCFGTVIKDSSNKTVTNFLSSGTEDMFLSAYYYNKGIFHTDDSGLTYKKGPGTMSAYKFFSSDPVFMKDSFSLLWRVGEIRSDGNCWLQAKENEPTHDDEYIHFEPSEDNARYPIKMTSYVWAYEW